MRGERGRQRCSPARLHFPLIVALGDFFEMLVRAEPRRSSLLAEPGEPRNAVGAVAGEREPVGQALRSDAAPRAKGLLVDHLLLAAIDLHDARAGEALAEVL